MKAFQNPQCSTLFVINFVRISKLINLHITQNCKNEVFIELDKTCTPVYTNRKKLLKRKLLQSRSQFQTFCNPYFDSVLVEKFSHAYILAEHQFSYNICLLFQNEQD